MRLFLLLAICLPFISNAANMMYQENNLMECYELTTCLSVAGINTYNMKHWPLNMCDKDYIMKCLVLHNNTCNFQVTNIVQTMKATCNCVKSVKSCAPIAKEIFEIKDINQISKLPSLICDHIGDLNNCVAKNEYNCPISKRLTNYLDIVNSECKLKECIKTHGACWQKLSNIVEKISDEFSPNEDEIKTLESICREYPNVIQCYDSYKESGECNSVITQNIKKYLGKMDMVCSQLPIIKSHGKCFAIINTFLEDVYDEHSKITDYEEAIKAIENNNIDEEFCGAPIVDFNSCINKLEPLPLEIKNIKYAVDNFCKYQGCTKNINKCFVKISSDLETKIDNGEITFINPNLPLLCKYNNQLTKCIVKTLSEHTCSKSQTNFMSKQIQVSSYICNLPCQNKTVHCLNTIATTLLTPRKEFMTIDQCNKDNAINKCLVNINQCEGNPLRKKIDCNKITCASAIATCGTQSLETLKDISFNKESIKRACRIIKNVGLCLAGIRKTQCLNMFSQELNLEFIEKTILPRCESIIDMTNNLIPLETVENFITLSMRVHKPFEEHYYDMNNIDSLKLKDNIEQSLKKIYMNAPGFKSLDIVRFYPGSLGFDYTIEMDKIEEDNVFEKAQQFVKMIENTDFYIGKTIVRSIDTPLLVANGQSLNIHSPCSKIDLYCDNGSCKIENNVAKCECNEKYSGEYCKDIKYTLSSSTTVAYSTLVLSVCSILSYASLSM